MIICNWFPDKRAVNTLQPDPVIMLGVIIIIIKANTSRR